MAKTLSSFETFHGLFQSFVSQQTEVRFSVTRLRLRHFFILECNAMPDTEGLYQTLYHIMVSASEDALTALEGGNVWDAKRILIDAEQRAEELYSSSTE